MNMSMRDKKILLMFLGVFVFIAGWLFGYRPQMQKAAEIESENAPFEERLKDLLALAENKDFYIEETSSIQQKIKEYISEFPADVKEENGIVLAKNMENSLDLEISNVGLGEKTFVAALDGSTEEDLLEAPDETMSEQANAQTQAGIDEIEGTDTAGVEALQDASDAAVENQIALSSTPVLYRTQNTLQFTGTYAGLKDAVSYLAQQSGRMTLDNVNASFDPTTGNLMGAIVVNMFSMTGTDNVYTEPDAGQVPYGTSNIFGTIESAQSQNPDSADSGDAGSDGQTDNSQEEENTQDTSDSAQDGSQS